MIFIVSPLRAFNCTNIVGVLRGGGDVRMAALLDVIPLWLFSLPLTAAAGLIFRLDIFWVYLATHMENIPKCIWGAFRVRSGKWIHDVTLPSSNQTK
jgi:Na+-driven multidrug efflux pump